MRLPEIERGDSLGHRLLIRFISLVAGMRLPDAARVAFYHREFLGVLGEWTQAAMRGASPWSVGERELMAALVAKWNACDFCVGAHRATSARGLTRETVDAALTGKSTALIAEERGSSPRTIANLLARAYRKLGVRSRFELAALMNPGAPVEAEASALSDREQAVLAHLARGECNKAIAYELQLAEGSVSTYLKRAAEKLGVQGRMMLIHRGRQLLAAGGLSIAA